MPAPTQDRQTRPARTPAACHSPVPSFSPRGRGLLAAALVSVSAVTAAQADPIAGEVILSAGPVFLQAGDERIPLERGSALQPGQTVVTGEGGFAHVRMADGGLVAIRPMSHFEIEVFEYAGDATRDRVRYRLDDGVARTITGGVGELNKEAFRLNTPVAAVGVRGTDFVVATDPSASRVAINSGAVVVAALGEHCSAAGFGACADGGVVLGKTDSLPGQFIEVVRGEPSPRLVQDPSQTPDRLSPPHQNEPEATRTDRLPDSRLSDSGVVVERPAASSPPPVPRPPAASEVAIPDGVHWGRWSHAAAVDDSSTALVSDLVRNNQAILVVNSRYGAGLERMATQLPRSGRADFVAAGGEAALTGHDGTIAALAVADGRLGVNFDQRSFATEARFEGDGNIYHTQAAGSINDRGFLRSDPALSNAHVTGALGADLDSAVTTVERQFDTGSLSGVVVWGRP